MCVLRRFERCNFMWEGRCVFREDVMVLGRVGFHIRDTFVMDRVERLTAHYRKLRWKR